MRIKIEAPNDGENPPERIGYLSELALYAIRNSWPKLRFGAVNLYIDLKTENGNSVDIGSTDEDGYMNDPVEILIAREDRRKEHRPSRGNVIVIRSPWSAEDETTGSTDTAVEQSEEPVAATMPELPQEPK